MQQRNRLVILLILLLAVAAACGGEEVSPEAEQATDAATTAENDETEAASDIESDDALESDTQTPPEEPAEEPAQESGGDGPVPVTLGDPVTSEQGGFSVAVPLGYEANESGGSIDLSRISGEQSDPRIFIAGGPSIGAPDEVIADFANSMGEDISLGETETVTLAGLTGATADIAGQEDGQPLVGRMLVVGDETQVLIIFAAAAPEKWETEGAATFEAVLDSLTVFAPNLGGDDGDTAAADPAEAAADVTVAARGSSDPGFACFGSSGRGLTCLGAEGQWQTFTRETSDLGGDFINDLATCADGTILIANSAGIVQYDGATFRRYDDAWDGGGADAVACADDGAIWVGHFEGVSVFDGSSWTTFPAAELATDEYASDLVYDVVVDGAGTVWAITPNAIAAYDGTAWTRYQTGEGLDQEFFFDGLVVDADGGVWATAGNRVLQFVAGVWDVNESDAFISIEDAAVDGNNQLFLATFADGVQVFDGSAWRTLSGELTVPNTRAVAVDGNGRLWVGTTFGLNVYDGDAWTTYNMDSADLVSNEITDIAVVAGGPTLPPPVDKENGSLVGSITLDAAAFADARVEICVQELFNTFSGQTPCSGQPVFFSTTTDADGSFSFTDVPVGEYVITVETADGWAVLRTDLGIGSELVPVFAGEETAVGELLVESGQ